MSSSGAVTSLDQAASPPLGWAERKAIDEARLALPSQMTLLAYTDGLVERRGVGIDEGIERLADAASRADPQLGADDAADVLLEKMVVRLAGDDDMALLLVRLSEVPAAMRIEIPSDPAVMRGSRARFGAWLERRGLDDDQQADAMLAVTEACNNAIEHGYRPTRERFGSRSSTAAARSGSRSRTTARGCHRRRSDTRPRSRMIMEGTMHTATSTPVQARDPCRPGAAAGAGSRRLISP